MRKKPKDHGAKKLVEGLPKGETLKGRNVVVVEDVTTTGGSALQAVEALRQEGANIVLVLTIVDRLEGAAETFRGRKAAVPRDLYRRRVPEGLIPRRFSRSNLSQARGGTPAFSTH